MRRCSQHAKNQMPPFFPQAWQTAVTSEDEIELANTSPTLTDIWLSSASLAFLKQF